VSTSQENEPETEESNGYEWPDEAAGDDRYRPGFYLLAIMYVAPFLILILFPALAWLVLLPFSFALRWNAQPPHRRRLEWIYAITGLISLAPWVAWILS
jgi:hypothetical protein